MKFGVILFLLRHQQVIDVTLQAETLGFDSVWLGEHVITPAANESSFPYAGQFDDGHRDFNANIPFFDSYGCFGYLAAITRKVRLGLGVSILPLHDPFHLARQVATLDIFSGGRFILGVGSGWLKEEFDIMGVDFATRGKRLDETLDIMERLFTEDVTTYDGEIFKVPGIGLNPKPLTQPRPPFHIGGHAKVALRRAALRGDGWYATALSPEELKAGVDQIKAIRGEAGLTGPFEVSCGLAGGGAHLTRDLVERYRDAGADRLLVSPWTRGREAVDGITRFAETFFEGVA